MSRRLAIRLAALALIFTSFASLVACGGPESVTAESMTKAAAAAHSVNGLCPVMERLVTPDGGSAEYKGQKIAFCCPGCSATFNKDPEKWMGLMRASPAKFGYKP